MNNYKFTAEVTVSANNPEAAEDILREIMGSDEAIVEFSVEANG